MSATALIAATTNEPKTVAVQTFKAALRARYEQSDWLNVLKPINDEMRALQRDALVAYILHQMQTDSSSQHIDTPEKLFEYFLMDVQMDPCMQTSRVRHALSSVQLFTERCFMNLETNVAPSIFEDKQRRQWEWMKRYRVWEANRKVFLWPENWIEPELRLDQSPIFKEAMSELLQSDITEDRAATALLNYLSKLEEVAKLEPCGIHFVEAEAGTADDIAHVVARTIGANRQYFYRRYEDGLWRPWEKIKLDIDDNPVIPVIWNDRLFLLWVKILKQAPLDGQIPQSSTAPKTDNGTEDKSIAEYTAKQLKSDIQTTAQSSKVTVQAVLCWSEYYDGKWQPIKTSDVDHPLTLNKFSPTGFDRSLLWLAVSNDWANPDVGGLRVFVGNYGTFLLYNTHGLPVIDSSLDWDAIPDQAWRFLYYSSSPILQIDYFNKGAAQPWSSNKVLENKLVDYSVQPRQRDMLKSAWSAPFFYYDSRHVFYVTSKNHVGRVQHQSTYGVGSSAVHSAIAPMVMQEFEPPGSGPYELGVTDLGNSAFVTRFVSQDAYIKKGIPLKSTVSMDGALIGPSGRQIDLLQKL